MNKTKFIYFCAAATLLLCAAACNKPSLSEVDPSPIPEMATLTVGVSSGPATKSTSITSEDEAAVSNLQVLVFRTNGALDAYGTVDNASELQISCTTGEKKVYAVVNAPSLAAISTEDALKATSSLLADNTSTAFEMIGSTTVTLPHAGTVNIDVNRIVSKIVLKSVTKNFTSAALAAKTFTIDEIFITNVAGDINFGLTAAPTVWFNQKAYASEQAAFTHDAPDVTVGSTPYGTEHRFYAYPNPTSTSPDPEGGDTWSPRHTRLVLKTTLGTDIYYYPITLPILEPNKSYEINNLTITRPGSSDPDIPVSINDCTFSITVLPWTSVSVSEGTTI